MSKGKLELVKTIILSILIITSFIQVGILWGYQQHGLPFNFLSALFHDPEAARTLDYNKAKNEIFKPSRLIVSEGYDGSRWIIDESESIYNELWSEGEAYIKAALSAKPDKVYSLDEWNEKVVRKKAVIFEFDTNISTEIASWFLKAENVQYSELTGIYKVAIRPGEDINSSKMVVYIMDSKELHRYVLPVKELFEKDYDTISKNLRRDTKKKSYLAINDKFSNIPVRQDMLFSINSYADYDSIKVSYPEDISLGSAISSAERKELADYILGSEKYSYESYTTNEGAIVYINVNNIYSMHSDGVLEYRSRSTNTEEGKGRMNDAFERALEFIYKYKRRQLSSGAELYLSGISEEKGVYRFTFDYHVDNIPVHVDYVTNIGGGIVLTNAITIEATSERVEKCYWLFRSFELLGARNTYNVDFTDLYNRVFSNNEYWQKKFLEAGKKIIISDLNVSYQLSNRKVEASVTSASEYVLKPVWLFETTDALYKYVVAPMVTK